MLRVLPCDEGAVLHHLLLNEDALGCVRLHHAAVLVPRHLHVFSDEGGLALERQAVPLKNHLPLGWSQLEGRQLQRGIWGNQRRELEIGNKPTLNRGSQAFDFHFK